MKLVEFKEDEKIVLRINRKVETFFFHLLDANNPDEGGYYCKAKVPSDSDDIVETEVIESNFLLVRFFPFDPIEEEPVLAEIEAFDLVTCASLGLKAIPNASHALSFCIKGKEYLIFHNRRVCCAISKRVFHNRIFFYNKDMQLMEARKIAGKWIVEAFDTYVDAIIQMKKEAFG